MLIHVGLPKAASTYIQAAAHQRGDVRVLQWNTYASDVVAEASQKAYGHISYNNILVEPLQSTAIHTFVSCEELVGWAPSAPKRDQILRYQEYVADRLFADWPEARVVIITRQPASFFDSYYSQVVKEGETMSPRKYARCWGDFLVALVSYDAIRRIFIRRFGEGRVLLLPMELLAEDPDKFYDLLESYCGFILRPRSPQSIQRNRGLSNVELRAVRLLSRASELMMGRLATAEAVADLRAIKRQFISRYLESQSRSQALTRRILARLSVQPDTLPVSHFLLSAHRNDLAKNMSEVASSPQPHHYFAKYRDSLVEKTC